MLSSTLSSSVLPESVLPTAVTAFSAAMLITAVSALAVSGWLWWRARGQVDLRALAGFGAMMAAWCSGHWLIQQGVVGLGVTLVLANPLMPTFFLHFAVAFVDPELGSESGPGRLRRFIPVLYALSLAVMVVSLMAGGATAAPWLDFPAFFVLRPAGWFNMAYTVLVGILAHGVLIWGFLHYRGNRRRSIVAMFLTGALGLLLATSFILPSLRIDAFPYPMLLLPSYVVLLVYGVVRYQMLEVNVWANRALLWLVMMLVLLGVMGLMSSIAGRLGLDALSEVPGWQLWLYSVLALAVTMLVYRPLGNFARSLVYPGSRLDETQLEHWLSELRLATNWRDLAAIATAVLTRQVGLSVRVLLGPEGREGLDIGREPTLLCVREGGEWTFELSGWQDFSPGQRLTAEVFASLLVSICAALERSLRLAQAERHRLAQQHLVELGELSAAMAHELRNPLNIIAMASAQCDPQGRAHIKTQIDRADRLIQDMLVYSGRLDLHYQPVRLRPMLEALLSGPEWRPVRVELVIEPSLTLRADPHRLQQVLINLLDNARAFAGSDISGPEGEPRIRVEADEGNGSVKLRFHNNGPPIAEAIRSTLFRPFISKRQGGSGLGLAIVRRIMEAHQGNVCHRDDLGWPCSFELSFPIGENP
ncbi:sensor histidine kinase [Mangrovitalea sediminis]|uniref:sensor histidine kinase n=1 Tax=Mangrovitalea sediminis TaxID=1982043 RepID=UPI0018EA0D05|nr:sensor histidine kinase [Mangrovitalea sediminis]